MHLKNQSNAYVEALDSGVFDTIPKAVWAAIAVSALTAGGDRLDVATKAVMREWGILNKNGIVPQKLPAKYAEAWSDPLSGL